MSDGSLKLNKLQEKLNMKDFKLSQLLEITAAINSNSSVENLLAIYNYVLREQLGIQKAMLFTLDGEWKLMLKYGVKGSVKDIDVTKDLMKIKDITVIESSSKKSLNTFDVVIPVFHKSNPLAYLLIGDLNEDELKISPTIKHMPFVQTLTNIIVVAIENKRMAKEAIQQARIRKELELASQMQSMLLPDDLPHNHFVDVSAKYFAHQAVGGDYYDFIKLNEDEFVFCMADVSGKGVGAALLMSNFQANFRAIIKYTDFPLNRLIEELNTSVVRSAKGEKFITFFIGRYNQISRKLKYINAGHNPPVLFDGKNIKYLNAGCPGLGMIDHLPKIEDEEIFITPKSVIVCYTDGLVEIENEQGEAFSMERFSKVIQKHGSHQKVAQLNEDIYNEVDRYRGKSGFTDDTALLSIRIN
ncbi:MAG: PP2C family protein-serine/threonine phosphatase [Flavobacteriales bacterium]|nr:PP2C family protein-serine/threonine phosphatase [Flavobacteriales bacterium]